MNLRTYLQETNQSDLAKSLGVTQSLISQWATGHRPIAIHRCLSIERATKGQVTRRDLRPDDWAEIWPELAAADLADPPRNAA